MDATFGYEPCQGCAQLEDELRAANRKILGLEGDVRAMRGAASSAAETTTIALGRLLELEQLASAAERWYQEHNEAELAGLVAERLRHKKTRS